MRTESRKLSSDLCTWYIYGPYEPLYTYAPQINKFITMVFLLHPIWYAVLCEYTVACSQKLRLESSDSSGLQKPHLFKLPHRYLTSAWNPLAYLNPNLDPFIYPPNRCLSICLHPMYKPQARAQSPSELELNNRGTQVKEVSPAAWLCGCVAVWLCSWSFDAEGAPVSCPWFYPVVEQHDVTYHRVKPLAGHRERHTGGSHTRRPPSTARRGHHGKKNNHLQDGINTEDYTTSKQDQRQVSPTPSQKMSPHPRSAG